VVSKLKIFLFSVAFPSKTGFPDKLLQVVSSKKHLQSNTDIRNPFTVPVTMYCILMSTAIENFQYVINNLVKNESAHINFCQITLADFTNLCLLSSF
jgi:hypothetical protein